MSGPKGSRGLLSGFRITRGQAGQESKNARTKNRGSSWRWTQPRQPAVTAL